MTIIGIDISKLYFDAHINNANRRFKNNAEGIQEFIQILLLDSYCVMESTGAYSFLLAETLAFSGIKVSIINGLCVKRFAQMTLSRTKTDANDAKLITAYAKQIKLTDFIPLSDEKTFLKQKISALESLKVQKTATTNSLEALAHLPRKCTITFNALQSLVALLDQMIKDLSKKIDQETREIFGELSKKILTIPGVGIGTVSQLLVITDGLCNFNSSKSLAAFVGICPSIRQSGTSLRGPSSISRLGHGEIRAKLYMCALTAMRKNKPCQELYQRMVDKGRPKKVALVAVGHKLLKQIFAIAKSGIPYNENYLIKS